MPTNADLLITLAKAVQRCQTARNKARRQLRQRDAELKAARKALASYRRQIDAAPDAVPSRLHGPGIATFTAGRNTSIQDAALDALDAAQTDVDKLLDTLNANAAAYRAELAKRADKVCPRCGDTGPAGESCSCFDNGCQ